MSVTVIVKLCLCFGLAVAVTVAVPLFGTACDCVQCHLTCVWSCGGVEGASSREGGREIGRE